MSNNFKWDMHVDDITSRVYQMLGMIKKVLNKASFKVKKVAYLTLCRPIIKFSCEVWDPYPVRHETRLNNIQGRAVPFIANLRGVESVMVAREKLGLCYSVIDENRLG